MSETPEGLSNACIQLFQRGEMKGVAHLLRGTDIVAQEALSIFLKEHGETLADMLEGKPSALGITFSKLSTDKIAARKEHTLPHILETKSVSYKVGRYLIYAGALSNDTGIEQAIRTLKPLLRTKNKEGLYKGCSKRWIQNKWKEFKEIEAAKLPRAREDQIIHLKELGVTIDKKTKMEIEINIDSMARWNREYESGKVNLNEFIRKGIILI